MNVPYSSSSTAPAGSIASGQPISRSQLLNLIRTALAVGEAGFARRAALAWLTAYPGDLPVSLLHGRAIIAQNSGFRQAVPVLENLCQIDPEYLEAQELCYIARQQAGIEQPVEAAGSLAALGSTANPAPASKAFNAGLEWGSALRQARKAFAPAGQSGLATPKNTHSARSMSALLEVAEQLVHKALTVEPAVLLAAVTHLELETRRGIPNPALRSLAELYHARWPACLLFTLILAHSLMDGGEADRAVALLHEAAARDVTGQVPERLWGPNHPYRSLWPGKLETRLDLAVPAGVAAAMGWNQLPSGLPSKAASVAIQPPDAPAAAPEEMPAPPEPETEKTVEAHTPTPPPSRPARVQEPEDKEAAEAIQAIQQELDRLAESLKQPQLSRADGRFPIYVILSTRSGLETQYGAQNTARIELALQNLAGAVRARRNWGALIYFADEGIKLTLRAGHTEEIQPAKPTDAWQIKLALADLDQLLDQRGEMIGAVLIVGGPEVLPFHHLPNPVDDNDLDVPSDNPYATRDENYFVPEWPVGRLPGGCGPDPDLLVRALERIIEHHDAQTSPRQRLWQWWQNLLQRFWPTRRHGQPSLGYTAAIWKRASLAVFRPIGQAHWLMVSPPLGFTNGSTGKGAAASGSNGRGPLLNPARLGYFNLHGLPDSVEWYGQSDPTDPNSEMDYPIALRPQDIGYKSNSGSAPTMVFSEACYGAHIMGKQPEEAMALALLGAGSLVVTGSTCTAYGSVTPPLIAADLLGIAFWHAIREGIPAGEALRRAKVHLAREMDRRQGYLDGEDQKTLISFVLYGDPLAQPALGQTISRKILRSRTQPEPVKTVCDRVDNPAVPHPVPPEVMAYVKHVVSQYLPGMNDAQVSINQEIGECHGAGHTCPASQLGAKSRPAKPPQRKVVVLSKQVQKSAFVHRHYARITLDAEGKLVKLVVSR